MDEILAWELVEWSLGSREVELAAWWRWRNDLLVNKVSDGMTSPLSFPWYCWSLLGPLRNLMMNKLGFLRIDPSTIGLDSCGPLSNDLGLLIVFVKQALLSILSTILLHVLRLISSMAFEFQTWALFHKISWVNHWIWGFDSMRSKIKRVGNNGLWALIRIGSCETQALGLDFHSRKKKPCEPQVFGLGPFCFPKWFNGFQALDLDFKLKLFGSQILDLGLDSNKVMKASRVELGFQFQQSDVNLKPWTRAIIHATVRLKFKEGHVSLKPWAWASVQVKSCWS